MWGLRLLIARGRPWSLATVARAAVVLSLVGTFLYADYRIFVKLFTAARKIEELTPIFALGLIENFLDLVFLIGMMVLFFSAMTASIGGLFTDLDLELLHAAPLPRVRLALGRFAGIAAQSAYLVVLFLIPLLLALQHVTGAGMAFTLSGTLGLILLLIVPVGFAATLILLLVRYFPVRRVHQIAMTLAILVLSLVVVGIRMARPERLFADIQTDDVIAVLQAIRLPSADLLPSSWLAALVMDGLEPEFPAARWARLAGLALLAVGTFLIAAWKTYYVAWVRSRETSAPVALGAHPATRFLDRLMRRADPQTRAMLGKEVRIVTRDAAQWSQLFMMVALLFIYLYNIQMMPLEGDFRAVLLAYLNLGMSGFVIAAISLRFAFPSLSAEGKQFWLLESAPISIRRILWTKVGVYAAPLIVLGLLLTVMANLLLDARGPIWAWTLSGSLITTFTLVSMGVGFGAMAPDFKSENPTELAVSLSGLAYMALSLLYVGVVMFLVARPLWRFLLRRFFGFDEEGIAWALPVTAALGLSAVLVIIPMEIAVARRGAARRH
ncbi:MAG: hypothetical protein ABR517_08205 [Thermoanaerobaculia bacterium]